VSAYDNDPRVRPVVDGQYRVTADDLYLVTAWGEGHDERWNVTLSADARAYDDPAVLADLLDQGEGSPLLFGTADEAIRSLIGNPR
jgi:hypothetical protein